MWTTAADITLSPRLRRFACGLLVAALLALPGLSLVGCLSLVLRASPLDCVPVWSDEVGNWIEISAFRVAGLQGGYCTSNELTAPIPVLHFGVHGAGFPVVYGLLGRLFGWEAWSGPLFNAGALTVAIGVWLAVCRPGLSRGCIAALLVATFWPIHLYLPTTMEESLHGALAFLVAAGAHSYLRSVPHRTRTLAVLMLGVAAASVVRATWGLVAVPLVVVGVLDAPWRTRIRGLAIALVIAAGGIVAYRSVCSPHPSTDGLGFFPTVLKVAHESVDRAVSMLRAKAGQNALNFLRPTSGRPLEVLERYQIVATLLMTGATAWAAGRRGDRGPAFRASFFACLNLGLQTGCVLLLHDVYEWRDYRALAPHLLVSLLVMTTLGDPRWVLALALFNLAFARPFVEQFAASHEGRVCTVERLVEETRAVLGRHVRYDRAAPAWDNTVLFWTDPNVPGYVGLAIPPGIGGCGVVEAHSLALPPRSKYLVMSPGRLEALCRRNPFLVRPLARMPIGILYLNLRRHDRARAEKMRAANSFDQP